MQLGFQNSYKSINQLPNIELNDFTILTGVNGAGKSHLLEAIENGSVTIDEITSGKNSKQIRRFDWSTLVPNDTSAIVPYTLIQERDSHWNSLSSQVTNYKNKIKTFLKQIGVRDTSDSQIEKLIKMQESEIAQEIGDSNKAKRAFQQIEAFNRNFKQQYYSSTNSSSLLIERLESICKIPITSIDEDTFYKNYFSQFNPVNIFQQSFGRLFAAYEKMRVENEFREFRNNVKGQDVGFLSDREFVEQNGEPPWDFVNDILETANLDFRINKPDGYNDKPYKPQLVHKISADLINFSDLSSGEKILVSFALCLYYAEDKKQIVNYPKLLLFDEIDAPLHPSMTQSILTTIQKILVDKHGIKVILTTHSPSTVALSSESSIYVMTKDRDNRLQKTNKDRALAILTEGIPTLSIEYDNRRQIFVESKNDIKYYELIVRKLKSYLLPEISLNFISVGTNGENCQQVKSIVKQLVDAGNTKVYGIIDWDKSNISDGGIKVLGEDKRYSIENYIFDPILLATFLLREKLITRQQLNLEQTFIYTDMLRLSNEKLQCISNWLIGKVETQIKLCNPQFEITDLSEIECQYLSEHKINIPTRYLQMQGHELEVNIKEIFPKLKRFKRESELKTEILSKVVDDLPTLLSRDFVELFSNIQQG